MKKTISVIVLCILMYSCSSVPFVGRSQLSLISHQEVLTLSLQQYGEYISSATLSEDAAKTALVTRVGKNIADAVTAYYVANGMESLLSDFAWEFRLVADKQINAFCMPGGKIVIYEGILPYTQNEAGLAVVIGHEVAHAIAKHANERISQQMAIQLGAATVGSLLSKSSETVQSIGDLVFGLGTQYGLMLPYSRKNEYEADYIGIILMAMAGYDPGSAVSFWERMSEEGSSTLEFMNTHPSDEKRIKEIKKRLPEAMQYYTGTKNNNTPSKSMPKNYTTSEKWRF